MFDQVPHIQVGIVPGRCWWCALSTPQLFLHFVLTRDENHVLVCNSLTVLPDPYCAGDASTALRAVP